MPKKVPIPDRLELRREYLTPAAEIAIGLFVSYLPLELQPDKIVGVPDRGKEFATVLGLLMEKKIAVGKRAPGNGNSNQRPDAHVPAFAVVRFTDMVDRKVIATAEDIK